ncbi:serine/arginine repetitive matrix protein 2 isoform X2 [Anopheles bellator]|uniref:serine/arginine repetitive matrix protein 2 isoform X2 n=1 Tax=Anopheles bellator TaxID=139047 RepID=UPI00264A2F28|nr:serine/arginine repetitive matrix protein 2 isoform X2 [Anopheles bellator]
MLQNGRCENSSHSQLGPDIHRLRRHQPCPNVHSEKPLVENKKSRNVKDDSVSRSSSCDSVTFGIMVKPRASLCHLRDAACVPPSQNSASCVCQYHPEGTMMSQGHDAHSHQPYHHLGHNYYQPRNPHHHLSQQQQRRFCIRTTTAAATGASDGSTISAINPIGMPAMHSVVSVRETHHIAQAQQEKNAKLRDAFGISEYFVEGTSFDQDRKAKEDLAKSEALQKELAEKEKVKEVERVNRKRYALVRTPSPEKQGSGSETTSRNGKRAALASHDRVDRGDNDGARERTDDDEGNISGKVVPRASRNKEEKKKKKKKARDMSSSPNRKKDKKKKSKKNKKDRTKKKHSKKFQRNDDSDSTDTDSDSNSMASDALSSSERGSSSKRKKKSTKKKDKKKKSSKKKKAKSRSSFHVKSPMTENKSLMEEPPGREDVHDEGNHQGDSCVSEEVLHAKNKNLNDRNRHIIVDNSRDHYITHSQSRGPRSYNRDDDSNLGYAFSGRSSNIRGGFQRPHHDHGIMQKGDENRERRSRSRHRRWERSIDRERKHKSRSRSESRRSRQHKNRGSPTTERSLRRSSDRKRRDYTPQRTDKTDRRHRESDHHEPNDAGRVPSEFERQSDRGKHQRQRERDAERNRDRGQERERNPNRTRDHDADRFRERSSRSVDKQQEHAASNVWLRSNDPSKKTHVKSSPQEPQRMDKSSSTGSKKRNKSPELKQDSTEKTRKRPEHTKTMSPSALAPPQRSASGIPDASLIAEKQLSSDDSASDLSYSPARRDPDRYHDILHQTSAENIGNPEVNKMNGEEQTTSFGSAVIDNGRANGSASATKTYSNEETKPREDDPETKRSDSESRSPRKRPSRSRSRSIAPSAKSRGESSSTPLNKQQFKQHISSSETKKTQAAAAPEGNSNSVSKKSNNKLTSVSASSSTSKLRHSLRRDVSRSPEIKKRRSDRDAISSKAEIPSFKVGPRASRSDRSDRKFNNKRENEHETKLYKRVSSSPERRRTETLSITGEGDSKKFKQKKTTIFAIGSLSSAQSHGTSTTVVQQPVVKLHSPETSHSSAESDNTDHGRDERDEGGDNLDAFLPRYDDKREQEKDLSLLKALKNDLAAKAKQSLEKKKNVSESMGASGAIIGVMGLVGKSSDVSSALLVESRVGESRERDLQLLHTKQQPLDPTSSNTLPDSASAVSETLPMPSSTTMSASTALDATSNNTNNATIKKEIHEIISTVGACAVADDSEANTKKTTILQAVDNILKEKISGKPNKTHKERTTTRSSRSRSHSRSRSRSQNSSSSDTCSSRSQSRSSSSHSRSSSGRGSSRSRSRSSSPSTRSSVARSRTGSRSPSIPRRAGSPSFLDRRRITRPSIYRTRSRERHASASRKRRSKKSRSRSSSDSSSCSSRSSRSHRSQSINAKHRRQPQRRNERSRSRQYRPRSGAAHSSSKSSRREHPQRFEGHR